MYLLSAKLIARRKYKDFSYVLEHTRNLFGRRSRIPLFHIFTKNSHITNFIVLLDKRIHFHFRFSIIDSMLSLFSLKLIMIASSKILPFRCTSGNFLGDEWKIGIDFFFQTVLNYTIQKF